MKLLWLVFDDSAQDQCVTLRNKFNDKPLKISLRIRNDDFNEFNFAQCDDFIFKNGTSTVELNLGPGCKRDVFLKFTPSTADAISRKNISSADLVIKPHGLSRPVGKMTLKSTIRLQSLNYGPCRTTVYMNNERLETQNFVKTSSKTLNFSVKNEGTCDSFFKVSILDDNDANDKQKSSAIQFVLEKNTEKSVKMELNKTQCTVAVFTGPEVTRQLFKSCTSAGADSSFLLSQDFKCHFDGEKSLVQPSEFKQSDLKYFFHHIDRKVFDVQVQACGSLKDRRVFPEDPTFVTLLGEETEFEHTNIRTQNTVIECTTQIIRTTPEESHQKSSKNAIKLERDIIAFPSVTTSDSSSVAKVTLKNRTDKVGKFHIQPLQPPFECHYECIEVKPHFYLSVPIRFRPTRDQMECRTPIRLTNSETGEVFTATLVAFSNYYS